VLSETEVRWLYNNGAAWAYPFDKPRERQVAEAWAAAVVTGGGVRPSDSSIAIAEGFTKSLMDAGIFTKMLSVNLYAPDNLIAATTPVIYRYGNSPWINTAFVAGDLSVNGLRGDGATKRLSLNFAPINSGWPINVGVSVMTSICHAFDRYIGSADANYTNAVHLQADYSEGVWDCPYNAGAGRILTTQKFFLSGYMSGNRTASDNSKVYFANETTPHAQIGSNVNVIAGFTNTNALYAHAVNQINSVQYTQARLSFAAFHEGLTEAQSVVLYTAARLARVSFGGGYNSTILGDWLERITMAGGAAPSAASQAAVQTFIDTLISTGVWNKMLAFSPFVPDNLIAATTPVLRSRSAVNPWTNTGFIAGDLTVDGLKGDGVGKRLDTGITPAAFFGYADIGMAVYTSSIADGTDYEATTYSSGNTYGYSLFTFRGSTYFRNGAANSQIGPVANPNWAGYLCGSRTANNVAKLYKASASFPHAEIGSNATTISDDTAQVTRPITLFALRSVDAFSGYSPKRISFYALHRGLTAADSANLYAAVRTMRIALGGGYDTSQMSDWVARVVAAGGATPSAGTQAAMTAFLSEITAAGLATKVQAFNGFAPDNLIAACTPLLRWVGLNSWTNTNFVDGDLTIDGLKGDGVGKRLDTGIIPSAGIAFADFGCAVYTSSISDEPGVETTVFDTGFTYGFGIETYNAQSYFDSGNLGTPARIGPVLNYNWAGYLCGSRTANNVAKLYKANALVPHVEIGTNSTTISDNTAQVTTALPVFAARNLNAYSGYTTRRISCFAVTRGLTATDSANLYTAMRNLRIALGGGYDASFLTEWLARVAAAGGATPSAGTQTALATFISDLNAAGILYKMFAVNTFVPDNLIASLTPIIRGTTLKPWTNTNFVDGDLTVDGLKGDGVGKFLNTGYAPSANLFPSGDFGCTVYTTTPIDNIGHEGAAFVSNYSFGFGITNYNGSPNFYSGLVNGATASGATQFNWAGYLSGNRRSLSDTKLYKANAYQAHAQVASNVSAVSDLRSSVTWGIPVFAEVHGGPFGSYESNRISCFALHRGFTLAESASFYTAIRTLRIALGGGYDHSHVSEWMTRVAAAGGAAPSAGTQAALTTFVSALGTAGILYKMMQVTVFVPDNLIAACTPLLRGSGPNTLANTGFVGGDLSIDGLKGDGVGKWLNTGYSPSTGILPYNNLGITLYNTFASDAVSGDIVGNNGFGTDYGLQVSRSGTMIFDSGPTTGRVSAANSLWTGYLSGNRIAANDARVFKANSGTAHVQLGSTNTTSIIDNKAAVTDALPLFGTRTYAVFNGYSIRRFSFFALHYGLTEAESASFYTAVQTLRTSLGGGYV
jgi:hypothetical protein